VLAVIAGYQAGLRNRHALNGGRLVRAGLSGESARRNNMHPEDVMKPDLFSEILLLGSGLITFTALVVVVVTALARG
jgi:hypothetical protein